MSSFSLFGLASNWCIGLQWVTYPSIPPLYHDIPLCPPRIFRERSLIPLLAKESSIISSIDWSNHVKSPVYFYRYQSNQFNPIKSPWSPNWSLKTNLHNAPINFDYTISRLDPYQIASIQHKIPLNARELPLILHHFFAYRLMKNINLNRKNPNDPISSS